MSQLYRHWFLSGPLGQSQDWIDHAGEGTIGWILFETGDDDLQVLEYLSIKIWENRRWESVDSTGDINIVWEWNRQEWNNVMYDVKQKCRTDYPCNPKESRKFFENAVQVKKSEIRFLLHLVDKQRATRYSWCSYLSPLHGVEVRFAVWEWIWAIRWKYDVKQNCRTDYSCIPKKNNSKWQYK